MTDAYSGKENLNAMKLARNYNAYLLDVIQGHLQPQSSVLDFGAADGFFATQVAKLATNVVCIETDPQFASDLSNMGFETHMDLSKCGGEKFDLVYSLNVLEHIENDMATLREIRRTMKNNAKLILYVPACPALFSAMDRSVGHYRRYKKSELRKKLNESGFLISQVRHVDSLGFFAALLYKLVGPKSGGVTPDSISLYDQYVFPASKLMDNLFSPFFGKNILAIANKVN